MWFLRHASRQTDRQTVIQIFRRADCNTMHP